MGGELRAELRQAVAVRAYYVCEYCLLHEDDSYLGFEVDHIISLKHEGQTTLQNLAYSCMHCNRHKGTDVGSISQQTGRFTRLFNPRSDRWADHFLAQAGRIEPLTEIGEVTARLLDFNHPNRVQRRAILSDAGRYPTVEALAKMRE